MKKLIIFILSITTALNINSAPDIDTFFNDVAIIIEKGEKKQFVFGDNLAGYFEGYTHSYKKGMGYTIKKTATFSDFVSFSNNKINNKLEASYAKLFPYSIKNAYNDKIWDSLSLLSKKNSVYVAVRSDNADILSLLPVLLLKRDAVDLEIQDNLIVIIPKKENPDSPSYIAISSAIPFACEELTKEKNGALKPYIDINDSFVKLYFSTKEKSNDFNLYISFDYSKDGAVKKVTELVGADYVKIHKENLYSFLTNSYLWTDDADFNKALTWSKYSAYALVVEDYGLGIWAGLPWFRDNWGRDTFISLPGTLLVTGGFSDAKTVITNFSNYQNKGKIKLDVAYKNEEAKKNTESYISTNIGKAIIYKDDRLQYNLDDKYLNNEVLLADLVNKFQNEAKDVDVKTFLDTSRFYGRIPNRVQSDNIIYNTTDGTPWCVREMYEYIRYTGDMEFAKEIYPVVKLAIEGAILNYVDENGFLTHEDADTWMDAKLMGKSPWSPRGNRANDIQALWFVSLKIATYFAELKGDAANAAKWNELSEKLKTNFPKFFWDAKKKLAADRIDKNGKMDLRIRPNQLMLISIPFEERLLDNDIEAQILKKTVGELLFEYGICSLSQKDAYFHPYHDNISNYNKDAAYHNGTIWGWNAGFTISALTRYGYADFAYQLTRNLTNQILNMGCIGSMSELLDAFPTKEGKLKPSGTYSQAWSVAEFNRNAYQDYAGFNPNMINDEIIMSPSIPVAWKSFTGEFAFGKTAKFYSFYKKEGAFDLYELSFSKYDKPLSIKFVATQNKVKNMIIFSINPDEKITVKINNKDGSIYLNDKLVENKELYMDSYEKVIGQLKFAKPDAKKSYKPLKERDYLKKIVESGKYF